MTGSSKALVAFLCGITEVDPIKYDLLFERFLSKHRKSNPDIDLDFCALRREEMFNYAVNTYGTKRCALVSTFGMRKARASLRDTARVFDIPIEIADEAAKLIPQVYYDDEGEKLTDLSIQESIEIVPRLKELSEEYHDWFNMAIKLEDLPRTTSIHAAGTLISPIDLIEHIPLIKPNNENINATALNLSDAEKCGFIKYDFLSLATLSVIDETQKDTNYVFDFTYNDFDDKEVWDLIGSKHTTGLFQIGSRTYKERMHKLKPRTIKDLAACLALVRGPCISSGADKIYIDIIEGKREIELIHPYYDETTSRTNGILLYQEQLIQIAVNFGLSLEDGYDLMKAVSKKKINKIKSFEEDFYILGAENKVPKDAIDKIWKIILDAGLYCFNESHAVAYSLLCYHSAYLKVHFPKEYMTNCITNAYLRKEEIEEIIIECRRLGIRFKPLDINKSELKFKLEDDGNIRIGMCAIKSFGDSAATEVINKRPFNDLKDFLDRIEKSKCSKRSIVPAIFAGLFDCFYDDKQEVYKEYCSLRNEEPLLEIKLQGNQTFKVDDPYDKIEELLLGASLIYNPVNAFSSIGFEKFNKNKVFLIDGVARRIKKIKDKKEQQMCFITLETADGFINCTVFSDTLKQYKKLIKKGNILKLKGKKDNEDSCIAISFK